MARPTLRQILEKLGWFRNPSRSEYDISIYGGGPARLSAAVYAASEGLKTVLVERYALGGQAGSSPKLENYLGFPKGISGKDLAERAREQADRFGAEILLLRDGVRGSQRFDHAAKKVMEKVAGSAPTHLKLRKFQITPFQDCTT